MDFGFRMFAVFTGFKGLGTKSIQRFHRASIEL